jgi:hypothetical protein
MCASPFAALRNDNKRTSNNSDKDNSRSPWGMTTRKTNATAKPKDGGLVFKSSLRSSYRIKKTKLLQMFFWTALMGFRGRRADFYRLD